MKVSNWKECIESNSVIKISPDKGKSNSLLETSIGRIDFLNEIIVKNKTSNYIFESYYISILELLHAIVLLKGYKIQNHICLGFYIKEILGREDLFRIFDDLRFKRNSLTYYGKRMDFETSKYAISESIKLIELLKIF